MSPRDGIDVEIEDMAWSAALPGAERLVREAAEAALRDWRDGGVAILLTDDETVRDLNAGFRGVDAPTNVLAFPAGPNPLAMLGDVALAFGVCAREALGQGKPLADHLRHLVIHGVLHLMGYDHQNDAEATEMESREREVLAGLGVPDPYAPERVSGADPGDDPDVSAHAGGQGAARHG
jgi:probable rRNA maturation factor